MTTAFLSLLMASVLASQVGDGAAELRYSGNLTQVGRDGSGEPIRQFDLYCLLTAREGGGHELAFLIDERGNGGGWAWPERFGRIRLDPQHNPTNQVRIQLLHDHEGTLNPLEVPQPLFEHAEKLEEGAEWKDGEYAYQVTRRRKLKERDCWQIEVATNFGRAHTLWVDVDGGLLVAAEQRVFMGRGDQFELKMELDAIEAVDAEELDRIQQPLQTLLQLQNDLKRSENETRPELSEAQLQAAAAVIDQLEKEAEATPFNRLASVVVRDVKAQLKRQDDVEHLANKFMGQQAPKLDLTSLEGESVDTSEHDDKIVVLHFWEYHDEPLTEPYGQVGYLDFLNSRRRKLGVQVYGVAVDDRLSDVSQSGAAVRQIRKLKEFMNLSYPVTLDDGKLLEKFGDPRRTGAKLPLWVVIAPDGKTVHYKAGYYEIEPDEGLRQLDEVIVEQIKEQRGRNQD